MIAFHVVQEGIRLWAARATGLADSRVVWGDEPQKHKDGASARLTISKVRSIGIDERRREDTGAAADDPAWNAARYVVVGERVLHVLLRVHSRSQLPSEHAFNHTERARSSLMAKWSLEDLRAAGLSYVRCGDSVPMNKKVDDRVESHAVVELQLGCRAILTDERSSSGVIDSFGITSVLIDPGGDALATSLQLADALIDQTPPRNP